MPRNSAVRDLAIAVGGGLIGAASLPPLSWWPLGVLAGACCFAALDHSPGHRAFIGYGFGLGLFAPGLVFAAQFSFLGYVVLVLVEAAFFALAGLIAAPRFPKIGFVASFALLELARDDLPFGGLPLGGLPLGQAGAPFGGLARIGGPLFVDVGLLLAGAALAQIVRARRGPSRNSTGLIALLGLGAVVGLAGAVSTGGPLVASRTVALVEGGGPTGTSQVQLPSTDAFVRTLAASETIHQHVALIVWPEDTVPLAARPTDPARSVLTETLGDLARRNRSTLVAGATQPVGSTQFRNELLVIAPSGRLVTTHEKLHPVPFGEYVPLRGLVGHLTSLVDVPRDMIVGHGEPEVDTAAGRLGLLISYETFFPGIGRRSVQDGAELLVVSTNTASYASGQVPEEELDASRLQAIADGRTVVQAATVGITAVIAPSGQVLEQLPGDSSGVLVGKVALRTGRTPYDAVGEVPTVVVLGLLAAANLVAGRFRAAWRWRGRRSPRRLGVPVRGDGTATG